MADPVYIDSDGILTDGEAWVAIASTTLGPTAVNIGFTSTDDGQVGDWSQYMDLVLVAYLRSDESAVASYQRVMVNSAGTVTDGYKDQGLWGTGSTVGVGAVTTSQGIVGYLPGASAGANIFGCAVTTISDINSGKYKSMLTQSAMDTGGSGYVSIWATVLLSQAPVTSVYVSLYPTGSDEFIAGSRVDLFGVLPRMVA